MRAWESYQFANRLKRLHHYVRILLMLSFLVGLNYLAWQHFRRFDLTEGRRYALSPETRAYLQELTQPVRIVVTIPANSPRAEEQALFHYTSRLLQEYVYQSRRPDGFLLSTEFVDIYQDLARAAELARDHGLEHPNTVLVVSGNRRRLIRPDELITFAQLKPVAYTGEAALTSAIMEVTQDRSPRIYFVQGHQEARPTDTSPQTGLSQLARELRLRNFVLEQLDLSTVPAVPEDAAVLVVADPRGALLASEVDKLRSYLADRAGRLLMWLRPGVQHGMDGLFAEWGLWLPDQLVIEPDPGYREPAGTLLIRNLGEHPITSSLIQHQTYILSGLARPVFPTLPKPPDERVRFFPLLATSASSWAEAAYRQPGEPEFDPATDQAGPIPIAVATERRAASHLGINVPGGRMVVLGAPDLFANQRIAAAGNISLFFNALNWLLDRERLLAIPPRPAETYQIVLSQVQLRQLAMAFLLVPGAVALLGFLVLWIRQT